MDQTQDQIVEITMPEQTGLPTSNPQGDSDETQPQTTTISPSNPQIVWEKDGCSEEECEHYKAWLVMQVNPIQSDNLQAVPVKSPPVPGAGQKCKFCEHTEKYMKLTEEYIRKCAGKNGDKRTIPYIEELAYILDISYDTVNNWVDKVNKKTDKLEHPEFAELIAKLLTLQKLCLLQRTVSRYNPTGAIFQLKANHGMMETEKKVLTGNAAEPLMVEIISEKPLPDESE